MKATTRLLALALVLVMALGLTAHAEEKPSTWLSDELVEIRIMRDENASQPIKLDSTKVKYLEELLNVRLVIEAVPAASYADKKQVLIATDNMPDIMKVERKDVAAYARDGMFVNLSEHAEQMPNFFKVFDRNESYNMLRVDGDVYGVPTLRRMPEEGGSEIVVSGQLPIIRTDLMEAYDLENPASFADLVDVLAVFKENNPDLIPLTNRKGGTTTATRKVMDTMAYPLGSGAEMYYDEDLGGQWIYGPGHENFKEVLKYLNELYEKGLLDPDYATNTVDLWKEKMSSGKALMYFDNNGFASQFTIALKTVDESYKLGILPTMTNSLGQTRNFIYSLDWTDQAWVVSASSDKIDVCLAYLDWCFTDEGADVNGFGIEGETFEYVDGKPQILESVLEKYAATGSSTAYYDIQSDLGIGLLDVTPYVDTGAQDQMQVYQMSEAEREEYYATMEMCRADEGLRFPTLNPPLSEEQTERFNELKTAVENIVTQEWDKYIMGLEPIDNYDKVIETVRAAGAAEMEEIYNTAWAEALGE